MRASGKYAAQALTHIALINTAANIDGALDPAKQPTAQRST